MTNPFEDVNSEAILLSQAFHSKDIANKLATRLTPSDFYTKKHSYIFTNILHLINKDQEITLDNLMLIIADLQLAGGYDYLHDLYIINSSLDSEELINKVLEKSHLRRIADYFFTSTNEIKTVSSYENFVDKHLDLSNKIFTRNEQNAFTVLQEFLDEHSLYEEGLTLKKYREMGQWHFNGCPTHFADLDKKILGFRPGHLIVIGARPGAGKSSLMINLVNNMKNEKAGIFSLEMTAKELIQKLLFMNCEINYNDFNNGILSKEDLQTLYHASEVIKKRSLIIDDEPALKPKEIYGRAYRMKNAYGVNIIYVDYLQLMKGDDYKYENNQVKIASISRELKNIAKKLEIPVVALAQLNRESDKRENNRPRMSDLRESGAIEADADIILLLNKFITSDNEDAKVIDLEMFIEKNRFGETGKIKLLWKLQSGKMENKVYEQKNFIDESSYFNGSNDEEF